MPQDTANRAKKRVKKRKYSSINKDDVNPKGLSPNTSDNILGDTHPNKTSSNAVVYHFTDGLGCGWDWVKTLGQMTEKEYLPDKYNDIWDSIVRLRKTIHGGTYPEPPLVNLASVKEYSAWALDVIKTMMASEVVARMVGSANTIKWTLPLKKRDPNSDISFYHGVNLVLGPACNHEATYAAMAGIIIPQNHACVKCKKGAGIFTRCIVLPGFLDGACANCHYNNWGDSKCLHRVR